MACIICGGDTEIVQYKVDRCKVCNHTYIRYDGDGIHYHKSLYRGKGQEGRRDRNASQSEVEGDKFTEFFHQKRHNICERRIEFLEPILGEINSLLDIGAGGGTFLNMIKDRVGLVEGTEVSDICNKNLTEAGYKVYHGAFTQMDIEKSYDLVTCWHVLEHIENLKDFPKRAYDCTNKYLVLEVPINRRLRNPDTEFDGHFHYFSEQSLTKLFEDYFDVDFIIPGVQQPCLLAQFTKK